ncbi:hypothetical protein ACHQM5_003096 [Ranunculus cassubicifolius]
MGCQGAIQAEPGLKEYSVGAGSWGSFAVPIDVEIAFVSEIDPFLLEAAQRQENTEIGQTGDSANSSKIGSRGEI